MSEQHLQKKESRSSFTHILKPFIPIDIQVRESDSKLATRRRIDIAVTFDLSK